MATGAHVGEPGIGGRRAAGHRSERRDAIEAEGGRPEERAVLGPGRVPPPACRCGSTSNTGVKRRCFFKIGTVKTEDGNMREEQECFVDFE